MRLAAPLLAGVVLVLGTGTARAGYDEDTFVRKSIPAYAIPTPARGAPPADTVIGALRPYRIRKGDTLIDLARYYDLGMNEIAEANPGIDPWVPPVGATILLPTAWVLPCCTYEDRGEHSRDAALLLSSQPRRPAHDDRVHVSRRPRT